MKSIIIITTCLIITGCGSLTLNDSDADNTQHNPSHSTKYSIHYYVEQLARQLFQTSKDIKLNQSVAVGTFLPITDLEGKNLPSSNILGQQIQESLVTLATQAGLNVVEFKTSKAIKIHKNQDVMLSRNVSEIDANIKADYYLTGTYYTQEQNIIVNVRLIEVATHNVIAAATDLIPINVTWSQLQMSQPKVTINNNNHYHGLN